MNCDRVACAFAGHDWQVRLGMLVILDNTLIVTTTGVSLCQTGH